nr:NUDIX domain-containing protein [uncultured Flavobacterium sp.]
MKFKSHIQENATSRDVIKTITIDSVIFGYHKKTLEVLLVQHAEGNSVGKWGLPGGWIDINESLDNAALRILNELTGLRNIYLEQLKAFGNPDRTPEKRVITIGYYALINREDYNIKANLKLLDAKWFNINDIPNLIFDHMEILNYALVYLRKQLRQAPIGFNLLPKKFSLLDLLHLYEEILGVALDKSNFRRKILQMHLLLKLDERQQDVSHRAAQLYQFDGQVYHKLTQNGFNFEF